MSIVLVVAGFASHLRHNLRGRQNENYLKEYKTLP